MALTREFIMELINIFSTSQCWSENLVASSDSQYLRSIREREREMSIVRYGRVEKLRKRNMDKANDNPKMFHRFIKSKLSVEE